MVKKRWYDHDPTLSMAVSLLQNASAADQLGTVEYAFRLLEEQNVLETHAIENPLTFSYLFPFVRRRSLEQSTWRLLEVLKHLPRDLQRDIALQIIQRVYRLDAGPDLTAADEPQVRMEAQPPSTS